MLSISQVLGSFIKEYQNKSLEDKRDSRLVVPGLTKDIAKEIHSFLQGEKVVSYLVIGDSEVPNKEKNWIKPIGLTSKRIGSFVAVVSPGLLPKIQDSVHGSGGAVRGRGFSEEWPWIDDGNESFRFNHRVLNKLVSLWTEDEDEANWLRSLFLDCVVPAIQTYQNRSELLLEDILGKFHSNKNPELIDIKKKILFHLGIPFHKNEDLIENVSELKKYMNDLCKKITERYNKEANIRELVFEKANEIFSDNPKELEVICEALSTFLNGFGQSAMRDFIPLSFYDCWGNNISHWECLDAELLKKLFDIEEEPDISSRLSFTVETERSITSIDKKNVATFFGEQLIGIAKYSINENTFEELSPWTLKLEYRGRPVKETAPIEIETHTGQASFSINTEAITKKYKSPVQLSLCLYNGDKLHKTAKTRLFLCGEEKPAFAIIEPTFKSVDAEKQIDDEIDETKIETTEPVYLYLFSNHETPPKCMDEDENEKILIECHAGIWRTEQRIDPADSGSGQSICFCNFHESVAAVCLEAKDIENGEFTLEDELRAQIVKGADSKIDELVQMFEGTKKEPYRRLGRLNESARLRRTIESHFRKETQGLPLIGDILNGNLEKIKSNDGIAIYTDVPDSERFGNFELPEEAQCVVKNYSVARQQFIQTVEESLYPESFSAEHPLYASHPFYINNESENRERILIEYLQAYQEVLVYIEENKRTLEWTHLFALIYLDCLVNWDHGSLRNVFCLLSPWHPLVVAKRYMIQNALFERGHQFVVEKKKDFHHLTALISNISGFRWLIGLVRNDQSFEHLLVLVTSDPGWHLVVKKDVFQNNANAFQEIVATLRDRLGLDVSFSEENSNDYATFSIAHFMRAFPSRRSIGIQIPEGYNIAETVWSVDKFLHSETGSTPEGKELLGGVQIECSERLEDVEEIQWSNPELLVYYGAEAKTDNDDTDIILLPPSCKTEFYTIEDEECFPRGQDHQAVFSESLSQLKKGQEIFPSSVSLGVDRSPEKIVSLGDFFVKTLSQIQEYLKVPKALLFSRDLPSRLASTWLVVPGGALDPAVFVQYVRDGISTSTESRALWDYKVDIENAQNTYYVLSSIPDSFSTAVEGFFKKEKIAHAFISELGAMGIAIGGEALKSGRHALGVLGLVGAIRLMKGTVASETGVFHRDETSIGFLIPVDSFITFFGKKKNKAQLGRDSSKRTDLLAIQLKLPNCEDEKLAISACGIEAKFVSKTFSSSSAEEALNQAVSSVNHFQALVNQGIEKGSMPERLALLSMLKFGLRISSPTENKEILDWIKCEQQIYQSILRGYYFFKPASTEAMVVSTEGAFPGVPELNHLNAGVWIRLNKSHWPGVSETSHLIEIRKQIAQVFDTLKKDSQLSKNAGLFEAQAVPLKTDGELLPTSCEEHTGCENLEIDLRMEEVDGHTEKNDFGRESNEVDVLSNNQRLEKIYVGADWGRKCVYFDPQSIKNPLDNLNVMITGSSGSGKTQLLKYLICKIREQGKNIIVLDFKNDFASDEVFCQKATLERVFVNFDGLPFNPLIPSPVMHPVKGTKQIQCAHHISGIVSIFQRIYDLGDQQQVSVKKVIGEAFTSHGIKITGSLPFDASLTFPDLGDIGPTLEKSNLAAYNRLDPLFNLDLFRSEYKEVSFSSLLTRSIVLDFSQIPSDEIKNALAELLILSAHAYYNGMPHSGSIRQLLVCDEAHRLLNSEFMIRLVRECRAYGVGVILSSQLPTDFPFEISSSMATKILHNNGTETKKVKAIAQVLGNPALESDVRKLVQFEAFFHNRHASQTKIRTMNYPLHLIKSYLIQHKEASIEELSKIEGIKPDSLALQYLVALLERMGLVEHFEGKVRLLD